MNRREVIAGIMVPVLSRAASGQPTTIPVVAFVTPGRGSGAIRYLEAVRLGLAELGVVDGRDATLEHHVQGRIEQLPALVADLVRRRVAVICTITNVVALAVKAANADVPLVFAFGLDPVTMGLVAAINRPGGNATGIVFPVASLDPKRLELMSEVVPQLRIAAVLINPANPNSDMTRLNEAAQRSGLELLVVGVRDAAHIEEAFATIVERQAGALLVTSDPLFESQRELVFRLAAKNRIPAIYPWREYAVAGGLLSYGNNITDAARMVGNYAARIVKGDKPGELPVQSPTKFELVVNLTTAKSLGLSLTPAFLARADEVIE